SRRATRRRPRVHGVRPGYDRIGRMADERLADAVARAIFWRYLFSAELALGPTGIRRGAPADRTRLEDRSREDRTVGGVRDRATARIHSRSRGTGRAAGGRPVRNRGAISILVRSPSWRLRRRPEISEAQRTAVPFAGRPANAGCGRPEDRAGDAEGYGAWRNARPHRRRLPSIFRRRRLACSTLREDAVRPGATRDRVRRSRAGIRRSVLHRRRGRYPAL